MKYKIKVLEFAPELTEVYIIKNNKKIKLDMDKHKLYYIWELTTNRNKYLDIVKEIRSYNKRVKDRIYVEIKIEAKEDCNKAILDKEIRGYVDSYKDLKEILNKLRVRHDLCNVRIVKIKKLFG